jgi:hypothetical protein
MIDVSRWAEPVLLAHPFSVPKLRHAARERES